MEILVVNSGDKIDAGGWITDCLVGTDARVRVVEREELVGGFDPTAFGRVYLSGSERCVFEEADWISAQLDFVNAASAEGVPVMGICFGHQMIIRAFYGKDALARRAVPEVGWPEVRLADHWLFEGVPSPTPAFNFHFDEALAERIDGFEVIAGSDECRIHAVVHRKYPLVGVQFHPEIRPEDGTAEIRDRAPLLKSCRLDSESILSGTAENKKTYLPQVLVNFVRYRF